MILGIDFGLAHVGLATAETPLAEPGDEMVPSQLMTYLDRFMAANQVTTIVLGHSQGLMDQPTRNLAKELEARFEHLEVVLWDETLSSQEAVEKLRHKKRSARRHDHSAAAAVILQDYLDQHL